MCLRDTIKTSVAGYTGWGRVGGREDNKFGH